MNLVQWMLVAALAGATGAAIAAEAPKPGLPDPEYCSRRDADPEKCMIQDGPPPKPIVRKKPVPPKEPPVPEIPAGKQRVKP